MTTRSSISVKACVCALRVGRFPLCLMPFRFLRGDCGTIPLIANVVSPSADRFEKGEETMMLRCGASFRAIGVLAVAALIVVPVPARNVAAIPAQQARTSETIDDQTIDGILASSDELT